MILIFDTETTGLPANYKAPLSDFANWPRMVQIAWQLHNYDGSLVSSNSIIIKPDGYQIPDASVAIHGITNQKALANGEELKSVLEYFASVVNIADYLVGHNVTFDMNIVGAEFLRNGMPNLFKGKKCIDTKNDATTNFCNIIEAGWNRPKWPSLENLYTKLFETNFNHAHNAAFDVEATAKVFFEIIKRDIIKIPEISNYEKIQYIAPDLSHLVVTSAVDSSASATETINNKP